MTVRILVRTLLINFIQKFRISTKYTYKIHHLLEVETVETAV